MAEWDTAYINDLPDSAFACIDVGGTKEDGKTTPRSLRHYPHHNAAGGIDLPHLRNALGRVAQAGTAACGADHLEAHARSEGLGDRGQQSQEIEHDLDTPMHRTLDVNEPLVTLSVSERKLGLRLLTYNTVVESSYGPILFEPGAFGSVDPKAVRLRMDHGDPPTGLGVSFTDTPDAPLMDFRVSRTERGNDQLTLAVDGVSRGVSVGFDDLPGGPRVKAMGDRRVLTYPRNSARLAEVSTTWKPTFPQPQAGVMYVLSKDEKGAAPVAEEAQTPAGAIDTAPFAEAVRRELAGNDEARNEKLDKVLSAFDQWREEQRSQFTIASAEAPRKPKLHDWVEMALRSMRGQPLSPTTLKELALDDVVIADNPGLVPTVLSPDYDDVINAARPFLQSTREIAPPTTGTSMILPIITQRAVAGTQAGGEKTDLTTTATQVGTGTFAYQSVFGGADISIQMLNRAERSFFDLLTGDMGEAYALDADSKAIAALLAGYTDSASHVHHVVDGGDLDPEDPFFGIAWQNSILAARRAPDTIWMSSTAVQGFIDAKSPVTNAPLYSNLAAAFTAGGGPGGTLSGLRPVYVPALDLISDTDAIVGPSRGFVWAEDPARNLQVDVPSKAGRDIALVGGLFPAPRYANAFTVYTIAS